MENQQMICILCPIGCMLDITTIPDIKDEYIIIGNKCTKGMKYAREEMINPTRILTTTIKITNTSDSRLPVRTAHAIPKIKIMECMDILNELCVEAPIEMGDIIVENILETGVNVVASKCMKRIKFISKNYLVSKEEMGRK